MPVAALADWTQFQGDAAHSGSATGAAQAPYKLSWSLEVSAGGPKGQFGLSAPVLSGSTVIAVAPNAVIGVDAATGALSWTVVRDYGPSASPAVTSLGGRQVLLFTEGFGSHPPGSSPTPTTSASASPSASGRAAQTGPMDSYLAALDLATRKPLWAPVQLERVSRTGVTVDEQTVFLGDNAGTIYAIDVSTGRILWKQAVGGYVDTPLAVAAGKVYVSVRGKAGTTTSAALVALGESDGKIAWRYQATRSNLLTSAAVGSGAVVVGAAYVSPNGTLQAPTVRAIDAAGGTLRWSVTTNAPVAPFGAPAVMGDVAICVDTNGQAYAFDVATGSRRWDFVLNEPIRRSSPLVIGPQILIQTDSGLVVALDSTTGELVWRSSFGRGLLRDATPAGETIVLVRGGAHAGLVAIVHDATGALVRVASPTKPNAGRIIGGAVGAAIPLTVLLFLAGRWLIVRAGPAFPEDGSREPGEPTDPWEDP